MTTEYDAAKALYDALRGRLIRQERSPQRSELVRQFREAKRLRALSNR